MITDELGNIVYKDDISKEEIEKIVNYSIINNYCPIISCIENGSEFFYYDPQYINDEIKEAIQKNDIKNCSILEMKNKKDIISIYSYGKITDKINLNVKAKIRIYDKFIHFTNENCTKQKAIDFIREKYNKNYQIAFGNEENDYDMLDSSNEAYWIGENKINKKYQKIPFDNGKTIIKIIKENMENEDINDT